MDFTTSPLPEGWSVPEVLSDVVVVDGVTVQRAGVSSTGPSGEEVTGSAADATGSPLDRCQFELLERVSTMEALRLPASGYTLLTSAGDASGHASHAEVFPDSDAPASWTYSRSNGIAIHAGWARATERASWELAERDQVLRAWYGETRPERIEVGLESTPVGAAKSYEWLACSFPPGDAGPVTPGVEVVGVFGFPTTPSAPLLSGYGARPRRGEAVLAAVSEALQMLGFLWEEPAAERPPVSSPTALFHLEYYQWLGHRSAVRRWLESGHGRFRRRSVTSPSRGSVAFVDLTPPWLSPGLRVAKAVSKGAAPLAFGASPFGAHLPAGLRTHPIG